MSTILPAILENTPEGFEDKAFLITRLPEVTKIHVDFADGKFVPSTALPIEDFEILNPAFHWEAHLMVKDPMDFLDYKIAGFKTVVVHYEAFSDKGKIAGVLEKIKSQGMNAGLAINPDTESSVLEAFIGLADQFTIMSVKPGFQGAPFEEDSIAKIEKLRKQLPNAIIEVDGSVNETTIQKLNAAGADLFVAGSAIVKSQNPQASFQHLQSLVI
jgi:ribulose-phosphate 3-epimerase